MSKNILLTMTVAALLCYGTATQASKYELKQCNAGCRTIFEPKIKEARAALDKVESEWNLKLAANFILDSNERLRNTGDTTVISAEHIKNAMDEATEVGAFYTTETMESTNERLRNAFKGYQGKTLGQLKAVLDGFKKRDEIAENTAAVNRWMTARNEGAACTIGCYKQFVKNEEFMQKKTSAPEETNKQ